MMVAILIHALQAESDLVFRRKQLRAWYFNPRSPSGERRCRWEWSRIHRLISIHALQAESDAFSFLIDPHLEHFNPRSPSGERLYQTIHHDEVGHWISIHTLQAESDGNGMCGHLNSKLFQSTLSKRRATGNNPFRRERLGISIHALQAESDLTVDSEM